MAKRRCAKCDAGKECVRHGFVTGEWITDYNAKRIALVLDDFMMAQYKTFKALEAKLGKIPNAKPRK